MSSDSDSDCGSDSESEYSEESSEAYLDLHCDLGRSESSPYDDTIHLFRDYGDGAYLSDSLDIRFHRTLRVAKTDSEVAVSPSDYGTIPLYPVAATYQNKLPASIRTEGGVFFHMYNREAMWISFESYAHFAVKIHLAGVNVVTGVKYDPDDPDQWRAELTRGRERRPQDYIVTPPQCSVDGIFKQPGRVRQFVSVPTDTGYSTEVRLTAEDLVGGFQFEIIPQIGRPCSQKMADVPGAIWIFVEGITENRVRENNGTGIKQPVGFKIHPNTRVGRLKSVIEEFGGLIPCIKRLFFKDQLLEDDRSLDSYGIRENACLELQCSLCNPGDTLITPDTGLEPDIPTGGCVSQDIYADFYGAQVWDLGRMVYFKVHMVSAKTFTWVTGRVPPPTPIDAMSYAATGRPFLPEWEEETLADLVPTNAGSNGKTKKKKKWVLSPVIRVHRHGVMAPFWPVNAVKEGGRGSASQSILDTLKWCEMKRESP